ncbi:MAG: LLM class flavin-dependent oxidoreductase [Candidatus Bathyarchaeia archaeon]
MSPIGFGIHLPTHGRYSYRDILEVSIAADRLGFDTLWIGDHFYLPRRFYEGTGGDPSKPDKLDAWTLLSAIACYTERIRLGPRVSPLPFYNPGRLAKMVATVDIISGGRVNFGIGAGWFRREAISYGVGWGSHEERISRMIEALEIIVKLWVSDSSVTYQGRYYSVVKAPFWPKPLQKPYPPVWVGGSSDRIIEVAVRYGVGILPMSNTSIDRFRDLVRRVSEASRGRVISIVPSFTYPDGLGRKLSEWRSKIDEYIEAGADGIIIDFSMTNVPLDEAVSMLREFSASIFPEYKSTSYSL